jgi:hypothetical protein
MTSGDCMTRVASARYRAIISSGNPFLIMVIFDRNIMVEAMVIKYGKRQT